MNAEITIRQLVTNRRDDIGDSQMTGFSPTHPAPLLVARIGAEVGAVAHDVGFAVLDVVDNRAFEVSALKPGHVGLDRIGLV